MPQIEGHFRTHLEQASFSWLPQALPAELPHPLVDSLDTCCSLHLQGLASSPQQLNDLVLSLDAAYQTWYSQQVCHKEQLSSICMRLHLQLLQSKHEKRVQRTDTDAVLFQAIPQTATQTTTRCSAVWLHTC